MKPIDVRQCKVQVLVCANERDGQMSCLPNGGRDFFMRLKDRARAEGMLGTHWITMTRCLGFCNKVGTTVVLHAPEVPAQWFNEVTADDFETIWEKVRSF